jgi:hypothetical protein
MAAVDLSTCQIEFTVGIPTKAEIPDVPGMKSETIENGSADESAENLADGAWRGYMSPEALLLQDVGDESKSQIRFTVYAEWKDPAQKVVNQVLSAVKAKVANHNQLSDEHCRHQREWYEGTGWQNRSTGQWDDVGCHDTNYSLKSTTSARFYNEDFVLCRPNGYVWVYYDSLYARASTANSDASSDWTYQYDIASTWADGAQCDGLLHWGDFHTYPGEYNTLNPL